MKGPVEYCVNDGEVTGGSTEVGGIAGTSFYSISDSANHGTVKGGTNYAGGIAGEGNRVYDCYNTASVSGGNYVGGIIGGGTSGSRETPDLETCYSVGVVTGGTNNDGHVGALTGASYPDVCSCYYIKTTAANAELNGCGQSTDNSLRDAQGKNNSLAACTDAELKNRSTYASWDYGTGGKWSINAAYNGGFPALSWELDESGEETGTATIRFVFPASSLSLSKSDQHVQRGSTWRFPDVDFDIPDEFVFDGWSLDGKTYQPGDEITVNGDITVSAIWANSCGVDYAANGDDGDLAPHEKYKRGETYTFKACMFTPPGGKHFIGWLVVKLAADGETYAKEYGTYQPGQSMVLPDDNAIMAVAQWGQGSSDTEGEYRINSITLSRGGMQLSAIPGGECLATVSVTKLKASGDTTVCLAAYSATGQFRGLFYAGAEGIPVGTTFRFTFPIDNGDGSIARLKVFVIGSFNDFTPLGASVSFPAAG